MNILKESLATAFGEAVVGFLRSREPQALVIANNCEFRHHPITGDTPVEIAWWVGHDWQKWIAWSLRLPTLTPDIDWVQIEEYVAQAMRVSPVREQLIGRILNDHA